MIKKSIFLIRLASIVIVTHMIEVVIVGGIWYVVDVQARHSISAKLGVEPNWDSFEEYIATHLQLGMTHTEVIKQAGAIGPFLVKPLFSGDTYCEIYYFNVGPLQMSRGGAWWVCYDASNKVISIERYRYQ